MTELTFGLRKCRFLSLPLGWSLTAPLKIIASGLSLQFLEMRPDETPGGPVDGIHLPFQPYGLLCSVPCVVNLSALVCIPPGFRSSWLTPIFVVMIVFLEHLGLLVQPAAFYDLITVTPCLMSEIILILNSMLV